MLLCVKKCGFVLDRHVTGRAVTGYLGIWLEDQEPLMLFHAGVEALVARESAKEREVKVNWAASPSA